MSLRMILPAVYLMILLVQICSLGLQVRANLTEMPELKSGSQNWRTNRLMPEQVWILSLNGCTLMKGYAQN